MDLWVPDVSLEPKHFSLFFLHSIKIFSHNHQPYILNCWLLWFIWPFLNPSSNIATLKAHSSGRLLTQLCFNLMYPTHHQCNNTKKKESDKKSPISQFHFQKEADKCMQRFRHTKTFHLRQTVKHTHCDTHTNTHRVPNTQIILTMFIQPTDLLRKGHIVLER